jgi:putative cell wall-binding protein
VLVTTGADYPDALAASPVAYARSIPVVLARPGSTAPTLPRAASSAVVLGGRLAVGAAAYDALAAKLGSTRVRRISGATRYATAAGVAKWGAGLGLVWDGVALSTGENFPDALAGGAMSGRLGSVMLLTRTATLSRETASALAAEAGRIGSVRVLGKSGAVADEVVTQTRSALGD